MTGLRVEWDFRALWIINRRATTAKPGYPQQLMLSEALCFALERRSASDQESEYNEGGDHQCCTQSDDGGRALMQGEYSGGMVTLLAGGAAGTPDCG